MEADRKKMPMGYPWPGSKLTREDMIKLTELRNRTGKPITKLLHEAVTALYDLVSPPSSASTTLPISEVQRS
jgi:hypothetical protein